MTTPYQIRTQLLTLARDILESQSRSRHNHGRSDVYPYGTDVITTEQVIAEANKLNRFVSQTTT